MTQIILQSVEDSKENRQLYGFFKWTQKDKTSLVSLDKLKEELKTASLYGGQKPGFIEYSISQHFFLDPKEIDRYKSLAYFLPIFDLDNKEDFQKAIIDARALVDLLEKYGFNYGQEFRVCFSGSKGFKFFFTQATPARVGWHKAFQLFATALKAHFPSIDTSIYNNLTLRGPYAQHPEAKTWQIEISKNELFETDANIFRFTKLASIPPDKSQIDLVSFLPSFNEPTGPLLEFFNKVYGDYEAESILVISEQEQTSEKVYSNRKIDFNLLFDAIKAGIKKEDDFNFYLKTCPFCGKSGQKASVSKKSGWLNCLSSKCTAAKDNGGLSLYSWSYPLIGSKFYEIVSRQYENEEEPRADEETQETDEETINLSDRPAPLSITDAREQLKNDLAQYINILKEGKPFPLRTLFKATPGLGKTTGVMDFIKQMIELGAVIVLASGTKKQRDDHLALALDSGIFEDKIRIIEGRTPLESDKNGNLTGNCAFTKTCNTAQSKGLLPGKNICKICPFFDSCDYQEQFDKAKSLFVNIPLLGKKQGGLILANHASVLNLHTEKTNKIGAHLIILDEMPIKPLVDHAIFEKRELDSDLKKSSFSEIDQELFPFLAVFQTFLVHALNKAMERSQRTKASHEKKNVLRGSNFIRWLAQIARNKQVNLNQLLIDSIQEGQSLGFNKEDEEEQEKSERQGINFDFSLGDKNLAENIEKLPNYRLYDLAVCMLEELTAYKENREFHPRIVLCYEPVPKAKIILNTVKPYSKKTPIMFLDAYADPWLYEQLFCYPVRVHEYNVELPKNVELIQVQTSTSKKCFNKNNKKSYSNKAETFLKPEIEKATGKKILIYTHLAFEKDLAKFLTDQLNFEPFETDQGPLFKKRDGTTIAIKHFYQDRGDDNFKDFDTCLLWGTSYPDEGPLLDDLAALLDAKNDPLPIDRKGKTKKGEYKDKRISEFIRSFREYELLQALYRIRPASATTSKRIVIFSKLPLDNFLPGIKKVNPNKPAESFRDELKAFMLEIGQKMGFYSDTLLKNGIDSIKNAFITENTCIYADSRSHVLRVNSLLILYTRHLETLKTLCFSVKRPFDQSWFKKLREEILQQLNFKPIKDPDSPSLKIYGNAKAYFEFKEQVAIFKAGYQSQEAAFVPTKTPQQETPAPIIQEIAQKPIETPAPKWADELKALLQTLNPLQLEHFEEKAAVLQFSSGLSQEEAEKEAFEQAKAYEPAPVKLGFQYLPNLGKWGI